jgi:RNA polymerase sigma factor (sigma-70 family)
MAGGGYGGARRVEYMTDAQLATLSQQGSREAFGVLADRWNRPLYGFLNRVLGDEEAARDTCQEALLKAYTNLDRLREPDRFKSWLHAIALNLCRDRGRSARFRALREVGLDDAQLLEPISEEADPPRSLSTAEVVPLRRTLLQVAAGFAAAMVLFSALLIAGLRVDRAGSGLLVSFDRSRAEQPATTTASRLDRKVRVMEKVIDEVLVQSPNILVGRGGTARGLVLDEYGALFTIEGDLGGLGLIHVRAPKAPVAPGRSRKVIIVPDADHEEGDEGKSWEEMEREAAVSKIAIDER